MGVLCDVIIGDDARSTLDAAGVEVAVDTAKLEALAELLGDRSSIAIGNPVVDGGEGGPWVFRLPDDLVARLVSVDSSARDSIAAEWARIDEFELEGWDPQTARDVFAELCDLASSATAQSKALFLRVSL